MATNFFLKQFDTYPNLVTVLFDENGPIDLTGASVTFRMSIQGVDNAMIEKSATVPTQTGDDIGKCIVEFEDGDTDIVGVYRVEWKVTFADGKIATFPRGQANAASNFNTVTIQDIVD